MSLTGTEADLSAIGAVSGVSYTDGINGSASAQFNIDLPVRSDHPLLLPPRRIIVRDTALPVFHGVLDAPVRGNPWQVTATGLGPYGAATFAARYSDDLDTLLADHVNIANDVVDCAISDGCPWTRGGDLPDVFDTATPPPEVPGMLADFLGLVEKMTGKHWTVDVGGNLTFVDYPTSPTFMIDAIDTPGAVSSVGFYSKLIGFYHYGVENSDSSSSSSSSSGDLSSGYLYTKLGTVEVTNDFWWDLGWRQTKPVDLTGLGLLTELQVQSFLENALSAVAPAPTMTGSVTVPAQHLLSFGGVPARLTGAKANTMYRFVGVQPNAITGILDVATDVDMIAGQVTYDADSNSLSWSGLGAVDRDPDSVLSDLVSARFGQPLTAAS